MTRRCIAILDEEDERLQRDAPNDWFDRYRATTLVRMAEGAAEVEHILRDVQSRMDAVGFDD